MKTKHLYQEPSTEVVSIEVDGIMQGQWVGTSGSDETETNRINLDFEEEESDKLGNSVWNE